MSVGLDSAILLFTGPFIDFGCSWGYRFTAAL